MTSRLRSALAVATVAAATAAIGPVLEGRQTTDYFVSDYVLTIDLASGGSTARVTMDLTYRIERGAKSDGFKYIGNLEPTDLSGEEADGPPMRMTVEHQRETLIRWRFTPAGAGEKRVRVHFTIPSGVWGTATESTFDAPWAGIFKVPVRRAVYRLLTPGDWNANSLVTRPAGFSKSVVDGRTAVEVRQSPLTEATFTVTMRPALATATPAPLVSTTAPATGGSDSNQGFILGFVVLLAVIVMIAASAKRGKRTPSNADGSTSSVSSCAGGSSCSSGCGGGGCGGGCGG